MKTITKKVQHVGNPILYVVGLTFSHGSTRRRGGTSVPWYNYAPYFLLVQFMQQGVCQIANDKTS